VAKLSANKTVLDWVWLATVEGVSKWATSGMCNLGDESPCVTATRRAGDTDRHTACQSAQCIFLDRRTGAY